jgi:ketosteroid isomerase-like protein
MSNVEVVTRVYEKLMQRDVPAILATFDPNIEFRLAKGHPYQPTGEPWYGKDAVTQHFFMKAGTEWEGWCMVVDDILAMGDHVVVEGRYGGVYKPTGRTLDGQVCHVWRFKDNKITSFHQYVDTAHVRDIMGRPAR